MAEATLTFPPDFLWGTATSSHQVEGENKNNDWWAWEQRRGGRIYSDQCSDTACGWWAKGGAEADIKRMKQIHTNGHRMSIEWSRVEPEPGKWDHDALDRYREILQAMRKAGIEPMVTLHHFTNPTWIWEVGNGWLDEGIVERFRNYVSKVVGDLSDLCDMWCTINEPTVYGAQGYFMGLFPPGHQNQAEFFKVLYHLLLAHAASYEAIHDIQPQARVGIAHHMIAWYPRNERNPVDRRLSSLLDTMFNNLPLEAIRTGWFKPLIGRKIAIPQVVGTQDWVGLNYYQRYNAWFSLREIKQLGIAFGTRPGYPKGPKAWGEFYAEGLFMLIKRLVRIYGLPIYITENGLPDEHDTSRPAFMARHLRQIWKAIQFNWPIKGYYWWSLLDNFEWAEGYDPRFRFGLYRVDWETGKRSLTKSGDLYAEIAKTGTLTSDMVKRYAPEAHDELFPGEGPVEMQRVSSELR